MSIKDNRCDICGKELDNRRDMPRLIDGKYMCKPCFDKMMSEERETTEHDEVVKHMELKEFNSKVEPVIVTTADVSQPYSVLGPVYIQVNNRGNQYRELSQKYNDLLTQLNRKGQMSGDSVSGLEVMQALFLNFADMSSHTSFDRAFFIAVEELKERAAKVGADAVIGMRYDMDLDTTGFQYFYLQMYGTAVKYVSENMLQHEHEFEVYETNTVTPFITTNVSFREYSNMTSMSLKVLPEQTLEGLIVDVQIKDIFDDQFILENIKLSNWKKVPSQRILSSDFVTVSLPIDLINRIKTICVQVKKYLINGVLHIEKSTNNMSVKQTIDTLRADILEKASEGMSGVSQLNSISEIIDGLKLLEEFNQKPGSNIIRQLTQIQKREGDDSKAGLDRSREIITNYETIKAGIKSGTYEFEIEDDRMKCPLCGYMQPTNRKSCFNCGLSFEKEL